MTVDIKQIKQTIEDTITGKVETQHSDQGHFYHVPHLDKTFPSVTGQLQIIKDEGLMNWKMNRSLDYIFKHWKEFTEGNILEHLDLAAKEPAEIFKDAGDIGTIIHDAREAYFNEWIATDSQPSSKRFRELLGEEVVDPRAVSGIRAVHQFCTDYLYLPIACELYVYNEKYNIGGTLDDLGTLIWTYRKGHPNCDHAGMMSDQRGFDVCPACNYKARPELAIMDVKTSNQLKPHYWIQVAMYYYMFYELTNIKPDRFLILHISKENGTYKVEEIKHMTRIVSIAKNILKLNEGLKLIQSLRKDNGRKVLKI